MRRSVERSQDSVVHRRQRYRTRTPTRLAKTRPTATRSSLRHCGQKGSTGSFGNGSGSGGVFTRPSLAVSAFPKREGPWSTIFACGLAGRPSPAAARECGLRASPVARRRRLVSVDSVHSDGPAYRGEQDLLVEWLAQVRGRARLSGPLAGRGVVLGGDEDDRDGAGSAAIRSCSSNPLIPSRWMSSTRHAVRPDGNESRNSWADANVSTL